MPLVRGQFRFDLFRDFCATHDDPTVRYLASEMDAAIERVPQSLDELIQYLDSIGVDLGGFFG